MTKFQNGDILICRGKRFLSKAISKVTKSQASHAAVVVIVNGETMVFEAQKRGVYPIRLDNWQAVYGYDYLVFRPNKVPENFTRRVNAYSGIPYDKKLLVFGFIPRIFGRSVHDRNNGDGHFICSELVMKCISDIPNAENYTPGDVWSYCQDNKFQLIDQVGEWGS